jgi:uncharacterized MAPEG superfamily protein
MISPRAGEKRHYPLPPVLDRRPRPSHRNTMKTAIVCILIAGILPIVSAGIAKAGRRDYNNREPRAWLGRLDGYRARANAAQANAWEAFPFFAIGVLAAHVMQVPPARIDALALAFIVLRVIYLGLYIADKALLRSLVWIAAWGVCVSLYVSALG